MSIDHDNLNAEFGKNFKSTYRIWVWVVVFAIAFAWVESAAVVYLRKIFFDGAFRFPLLVKWEAGKHVIDPLVRIEFGREIATVIMLIAVSWVAGKNRVQKFCLFIIAFGIWDIFYYVWLYVMVSWPKSLMTWDLLFYVPLPWVGPVITPLLISLAMVAAGSFMIYCDEKGYDIRFRWYDMAVELGCGLLMILAFCWDWKNIFQIPGDIKRTGIPNPFAWWLFLPAYLFSIVYFVVMVRRIIIHSRKVPDITTQLVTF
jgi:hypothetical protein